jgi:hypothetical protein
MAQRGKRTPSGSATSRNDRLVVDRVQTGVRIEKRLLKVLKAFAELRDMSLSDLLEGIVLHAFDNKTPFSAESLKRIASLKEIYGLDLDASANHHLHERKTSSSTTEKESRRG